VQPASDPKLLARLSRLELRAKTAVEGLTAGRHLSPQKGSGTAFAEHRPYTPGDEPRRLDWRILARTDRHVVRDFEEETDLTVHLVVDASESMSFGSLEWSKFAYATWVAAALGWLATRQSDTAGLAVVAAGKIQTYLPPHTGERNWMHMVEILEAARPAGSGDPGESLLLAAGRMERRGLVVWISDCFGDPDKAARAAARVRHAGHDLLVLRVLDPAEIDFPYGRTTRFQPLELGERLTLEPRAVRKAYLEEFEIHGVALRRGLRASGAEFQRLPTDQPLQVALVEYLARRAARLRRSGR